jgi:hypothetical protein
VTQEDTRTIQNLIARFANSFDTKDWDILKECLTESVYTDYSDLRGTPPENVSYEAYVASRKDSLKELITHHLSGNYEVQYVDRFQATCRASMIIWRKSGDAQFTTHCIYTFRLKKLKTEWKIAGITQKVLWNEGNPAIHHGSK